MADSYRLAVLKRLTAHLAGITPANGYEYDLSHAVFRGRTVFGADDPIPMVSILESPRSDVGMFAGENDSERKENWSLLIQGWALDDIEHPTDPAYGLMDAVERRLARLTEISGHTGDPVFPDEYLLSRSVSGISVPPGVVRPPMDQVSSKAFFYLPVRIELVRANG